MRIYQLAIPILTLTGCVSGANDSVLVAVLDRLMTAYAAALASDSVPAMRRTGRDLIVTYDAAVGRD